MFFRPSTGESSLGRGTTQTANGQRFGSAPNWPSEIRGAEPDGSSPPGEPLDVIGTFRGDVQKRAFAKESCLRQVGDELVEGLRIKTEIVGSPRKRDPFARIRIGDCVDMLEQNEAVPLLSLNVLFLNRPPREPRSIHDDTRRYPYTR